MAIGEGNSKYGTGQKSIIENIDNIKTLELGEVISVTDPNSLGRIKVRIKGPVSKGGDDGVLDDDLPWAHPMGTKFFTAQPKIKEAVFIFTFSNQQKHVDRLYLGPIISQPQQLNFDPYYITALAGFTFGSETPKVSIDTIPNIKGVFPNPEDISIQGRDNTDIILKPNEVVLRAGKFIKTNPTKTNPFYFTFNKKTQAYIQLKNDVVIKKGTDTEKEEKGTVANIIASKINLLTHKDGTPVFNLTNQDNLISDDELLKILAEAHQLVFGDLLLEYLELFENALFFHVHNGNGNLPTDLTTSGNKLALDTFKKKSEDLRKRMLSKNIRIN